MIWSARHESLLLDDPVDTSAFGFTNEDLINSGLSLIFPSFHGPETPITAFSSQCSFQFAILCVLNGSANFRGLDGNS